MKITLVQADLAWEDAAKNIRHLGELLSHHKEKSDLVILPEMFSTGFTMNTEDQAEDSDGSALKWMLETATARGSVLCGSVSTKENGKYFNRMYWVKPDGTWQHYDKRHLFRMGKEHEHYSAGDKKLFVELNGWKICPLVCYDLRFPVWSRNRFKNGEWDYDLLIYVANWPKVRNYAWKQLLVARAIENQSFVIGANRVGLDGKQVEHSGDSRIIDPKGAIILDLPADTEQVVTIELDKAALTEFRNQFPVGLDADDFIVN